MPEAAVLVSNTLRVSVRVLNWNRKKLLFEMPLTTELPLSSKLLAGLKTESERNCKEVVGPTPISEMIWPPLEHVAVFVIDLLVRVK